MRTTLEIDDDVLQAARSDAVAEGKSVGKALSDLARWGLGLRRRSKRRSPFPVFDLTPNSPPITLEIVMDALDEE
jgi:hypothetical protein